MVTCIVNPEGDSTILRNSHSILAILIIRPFFVQTNNGQLYIYLSHQSCDNGVFMDGLQFHYNIIHNIYVMRIPPTYTFTIFMIDTMNYALVVIELMYLPLSVKGACCEYMLPHTVSSSTYV